MATVKLHSDGKVVLKDGKVSCSCCEKPSECCMYPADGLGDTYEAADLPDALTFIYEDETYTLTKSGAEYYGAEGAGGYAEWRIVKSEDNDWNLERETGELGEGDWEATSEFICLITGDGGFTPEDDAVEDQFEACYLLRSEFGETIQVLRVSLCLWLSANRSYWLANPETEAPFEWGSLAFDPVNQRWTANFLPHNEGPKQGNQNTPVGDYGASPPLVELEVELCP